ncbi:MAG: MFS transporter [Sulfolobaceae archaeon]|nr:MFS transporter [Sulfolobaceae archaeon]
MDRLTSYLAITGFSISLFLWGFTLASSSLITAWPIIPKYAYSYLLATPPLSLLLGNLVMGRLADVIGRKTMLISGLIIYSIGTIIVLLSNFWPLITLGLGLVMFSIAGGDEPAVLSYLSETLGKNVRGKWILFVSNFANIGPIFAAVFFLLLNTSMFEQKLAIGITFLLSLPLAFLIRFKLPESERWVEVKSSGKKLGRLVKMNWVVLFTLLSIALTTILTYGLIAWVVGPFFYPKQTPWIILVYNVGDVAGGLIGFGIAEMISRRVINAISYILGTLTIGLILLQLLYLPSNIGLFYSLLFFNGIFSQLTWGLRLTIESEVFPTYSRATSISFIRSFAWFAYVLSIFFTQSFTSIQFMEYTLGLWALGLIGSVVWLFRGVETKGVGIDELEMKIYGNS